MTSTKNIITALLSMILGVVTIFIASPKKLAKKNDKATAQPRKDENLFI